MPRCIDLYVQSPKRSNTIQCNNSGFMSLAWMNCPKEVWTTGTTFRKKEWHPVISDGNWLATGSVGHEQTDTSPVWQSSRDSELPAGARYGEMGPMPQSIHLMQEPIQHRQPMAVYKSKVLVLVLKDSVSQSLIPRSIQRPKCWKTGKPVMSNQGMPLWGWTWAFLRGLKNKDMLMPVTTIAWYWQQLVN